MNRLCIPRAFPAGAKAPCSSSRRGQRAGRAAAAFLVTVSLAVLAAACGGSHSSAGSGSSPQRAAPAGSPSAIGYSHCMRSHGVPSFPDPSSDGAVPKVSLQQLGVGSAQYQAAQDDCQSLLPAGSDDVFPPGELRQMLPGMLRFSQCVRSHGEPNWPDPTVNSSGQPGFNLVGLSGVDPASKAVTECQQLLPAALGGLPIGR
jgi:hypothetical protein